ncbi:MAG: hypothetical protein ACRDHG_03645 [Anaerolineales bacterium]
MPLKACYAADYRGLAVIARRQHLLLFCSILLVLSPFGWGSTYGADAGAQSPARQSTIAFTPNVTPLVMTVTLAPTLPAAFTMQASPVPMPPTAVTAVGTPVPVRGLSGGDQTVGYDFIDGSEPPLWRIWFEGRGMVVDPSDPSTSALLAAFLDQAAARAQAQADYESAKQSISSSKVTTGAGLVGVVAGGIVAGLSCAATPLTFWIVGGTGWPCVLGLVGAGAGLVATGVSVVEWALADNDQADASDRLDRANAEASSLFDSLEQISGP